jgi:branched-chain amino acid transport system substrate-binding protein
VDNRLRRAIALLAFTALGLAGCSRDTPDAAGGADTKTVKIGVIAPLTGSLSAFGAGIKNSVDLAVKQANESGKLKGWTIVLDAQDDAAKAETGAAAANKLASDETVAGVVGTLNSSTAQQTAPILSREKIAQISPANSNPSLTRGNDYATTPKRLTDSYFRVCANDLVQGPFLADYAYKTAGLKTVVTVHDTKAYGKGLVETFEQRFKADGGQVLSQETISTGERDFGALVTKIVGLKPDLVFYGGEHPEAAPLSKQLGQQGFAGPVVGGDGIQSADYGPEGGRSNDLATSFGAPTAKLAEAKKFVDDYKAAQYKEDYEAYGALSYDAANVLIEALVKALASASDVRSARPAIIDAVQKTNYQGVTGTTTFDEYGDTSNKVLTVNKLDGTSWTDVYTGTFSAS